MKLEYCCFIALLFILSCRSISKEIAVVNENNPCGDFILVNQVSNPVKVVIESRKCKNNWKIIGGELEHQGGCNYKITPRFREAPSELYLYNNSDTLEFFVLAPSFEVCLAGFGCKGSRNGVIGIEIFSEFPDLVFSRINCEIEIYKNEKLILQEKLYDFVLPNHIQETVKKLVQDDFVILKNIQLSTDLYYEVKIDSVINYYARHAFHF